MRTTKYLSSLLTGRREFASLLALVLFWSVSWFIVGPLLLKFEIHKGIGTFFIPLVANVTQHSVLAKWYALSLSTLLFAVAAWGLTVIAVKYSREARASQLALFSILTFLLLLFALPRFFSASTNLATWYSFNYNEGVNAVHTSRLLRGDTLYQRIEPGYIVPVNYPPLSFWIVASLARLGGDVLVIGRTLSLLSFIGIGWLAFAIVRKLTGSILGGLLSATAWCALLSVLGSDYIGVNDPQMLGQFVSLLAIYLFVRWRDTCTNPQIVILGVVASTSLFIKHTMLAAPLCIACALLADRRFRQFAVYAFCGLLVCSVALALTWMIGGPGFYEDFFVNLNVFNGTASISQSVIRAREFLLGNLMLLFLMPIAIVRSRYPVIAWYGVFASFAVVYVLRGRYGVGVNVWFEVLLFFSLMSGLAFAEVRPRSIFLTSFLALCVTFPVLKHPNAPLIACDTEGLNEKISGYRKVVNQLGKTDGAVLADDLLLLYFANKPANFEVFLTTRFITAGRIPEQEFIKPIRNKQYALIVTSVRLAHVDATTLAPTVSRLSERWTNQSINAIVDNYTVTESDADRYIYRPKR